jgi:hypothetical protein
LFDDTRSWKDFVRWRETANHILVYEAEHLFRIVPKRLLKDGDVVSLRRLLEQHLGSAA